MRSLMLIFVLITTAYSGCKKDTAGMTVVKDCTGVYLRFESKDYHVCNTEKAEAFADGAAVEASFEEASACPADTGMRCKMYHKNEGWVKITKIKGK